MCSEGYDTWSVCLSVVCLLPCSATMRNKPAKERHQRVQRYTAFIFKMAIFVKVLHAKVRTTTSQYANKHRPTSTGSSRSVYLEGARNHNEGRVSTPACYLLL